MSESYLLAYDRNWTDLGGGRFARVYETTHLETGTKVAIKRLNGRDKFSITQLENEMKVLESLNHPNITRIYSCFEENNIGYIVMSLCEGGTVGERIDASGYDDSSASRVIYCVTNALVYLHSKKIFHRDIKPANILYESEDEDSNILLCDFGLSKIVQEGVTETRVGTVGYQAPEILQKRCYDEKCDIWSLGIVAYELIARDLPFPAKDKEAVHLRKMVSGEYKFYGLFSAEAENFIRRCLTSRPEDRPSAQDLLLDPWLAQCQS